MPNRVASTARAAEACEPHGIRCGAPVDCAGQRARQLGALAGVTVPLDAAEHLCIVTERIGGVHPLLPVMRAADGCSDDEQAVAGLRMLTFEPEATP